jgi:hypothetical protein
MTMRRVCLVVSALLVTVAGCRPSPHRASVAHVRSLDPGHVRAQIVVIDRIAYDTGVVSATDRDALTHELDELASRATHEDASSTTETLSDELRRLADGVRHRPLDRARDGGNLRDQWESLRDSLFVDADWLRHSNRDPIASEDSEPQRLSRADAFQRDRLLIAVRDLEDAAEDGDRDLAGSSVTAASDPSTHDRDVAWQATMRDWQWRITKLERELPSAPAASANADYVGAYREAALAVTSLRNAAGWVPSGRQEWMRDAHAHLRVARQYLARIGG